MPVDTYDSLCSRNARGVVRVRCAHVRTHVRKIRTILRRKWKVHARQNDVIKKSAQLLRDNYRPMQLRTPSQAPPLTNSRLRHWRNEQHACGRRQIVLWCNLCPCDGSDADRYMDWDDDVGLYVRGRQIIRTLCHVYELGDKILLKLLRNLLTLTLSAKCKLLYIRLDKVAESTGI